MLHAEVHGLVHFAELVQLHNACAMCSRALPEPGGRAHFRRLPLRTVTDQQQGFAGLRELVDALAQAACRHAAAAEAEAVSVKPVQTPARRNSRCPRL